HRVAIVVVRHVVAPVRETRRDVVGVLDVPVVEIHGAIAPVYLHNRRDQGDDVVADVLDIWALVHGETIGELHERRRRSRLRRVDRARYVIDRRRGGRDLVRFRVVEVDRAWIGEFRQLSLVRIELRHQGLRRDRHRDHLASFFGRADGEDAHARRGLREQPHVLVDLLRVRQLGRSAGDVTERDLGRRNRFRGWEIVHERRQEERLRRVLADLLRVLLVDCLLGITAGLRGGGVPFRERGTSRNRDKQEREGESGRQWTTLHLNPLQRWFWEFVGTYVCMTMAGITACGNEPAQ